MTASDTITFKNAEEALQYFSEQIEAIAVKRYEDIKSHRDAIDHYDLSFLNDGKPRDITVMAFQPSPESIQHHCMKLVTTFSRILPMEALQETAQSTLEKTHAQHAPKEASVRQRKEGNSTITFVELAEPGEVDMAINDLPVTFRESNKMPLADYFPQLLQCKEMLEHISTDEVAANTSFPERIYIDDKLHFSAGPGANLNFAPQALATTPPSVLRDVLRHERGHVLHNDTLTEGPQRDARQQANASYQFLNSLSESIEAGQTPSAYFFQPDFEAVFAKDKPGLIAGIQQATAVAEHIKTFPDYQELDSIGIAVDLNEQTGLINHILAGPEANAVEENYTLAARVNPQRNRPSRQNVEGNGAVSPQKAQENYETFKAALADQQKTMSAAATDLAEACSKISQAREYLADIESVQHADKPHEVRKTFEFLKTAAPQDLTVKIQTHPPHDERIAASTRFADRVMQQRQMAGEQQHSR